MCKVQSTYPIYFALTVRSQGNEEVDDLDQYMSSIASRLDKKTRLDIKQRLTVLRKVSGTLNLPFPTKKFEKNCLFDGAWPCNRKHACYSVIYIVGRTCHLLFAQILVYGVNPQLVSSKYPLISPQFGSMSVSFVSLRNSQ